MHCATISITMLTITVEQWMQSIKEKCTGDVPMLTLESEVKVRLVEHLIGLRIN